jgi:Cyclic nucleotide-binding domain
MSAVSPLARSLGVEAGEGRVFVWGAMTLFLIGWASVSLTNVSETFFLKRVGVDRLPVVFLVNSLLLVATTYVVSRSVARTTHRLVLTATFAGLAAVVLGLWLLVVGQVYGVFVLLVIASKQIDAIALIAFWIVLGGILHGRQAKRLYAPMIAGGTLGRILGSFASGIIGNALGIRNLLPVCVIALLLASLLAMRLRSTLPVHVTHMTRQRSTPAPPTSLAKLGPLWRQSRLFRLLALSALLAGTLGPMLYFQFSYIVDVATRGSNAEMRLLDVYAKLRGFINVGVLGMQLLGTPRVFRRIGVPLAATLSPLVYLVGFFGVSTRLDLQSGIGAVGTTNLQDHAIQEPAQRILVTLLPERLRAAATSLIEGPIQRMGGAFGNVLVLSALAVSTPRWVGLAALPIAGLWLAVATALWRIYPTLLLEVAASGPMHAEMRSSLPEMVDPGTLRVLASSLVASDLRRCRAACGLVIEAPRQRAIATLTRAIRDAPAANRPLLIATLHDLLERHTDAQRPMNSAARDLEPLLTDAGVLPVVERARLVEAYARLVPPARAGSRGAHVLRQLLDDPTAAVRLAAQVSLRRTEPSRQASEDLDALLADIFAGTDAAAHHTALEALRALLLATDDERESGEHARERWQSRLTLVAQRLNDPQDRARAAEVLADTAVRHGARLAALASALLPHADDREARVRAAVLRFVGHARLEQHAGWLIERLAATTQREAAAAREALHALGPAAMNALLHALEHGKRAVRDAILPILRDMPVNTATLATLIDREVGQIHEVLLQMHGLLKGPAPEVVLQRLTERVAEGLHTTLLLFAALLHEERIAALGRFLARSPDRRRHAVLLEALEALLPPAQSARLLPLLEQRDPGILTAEVARLLGGEPPSFDEAVRATLADRDRLTRELLAATLDPDIRARLGDAAHPPGPLAPATRLAHHEGGDAAPQDPSMLNRVEIMLQLRSLELFGRVTTRDLSELAGLVREEAYQPGRPIVREGDVGDCMYVIVEGAVHVTRAAVAVARLTAGDFFGEMSLFDAETRFATVTAATRVRLLRLERRDLLQLMDDQPGIAIAMCQTLSGRVRDLINQIEGRGPKDSSET